MTHGLLAADFLARVRILSVKVIPASDCTYLSHEKDKYFPQRASLTDKSSIPIFYLGAEL